MALPMRWLLISSAIVGICALVFVIGRTILGATGQIAFAQEDEPMSPYAGKAEAPDFPKGLDWLNTDRPLTFEDLEGKVVVLDFWTYCCINCMHVLPDLKKLERKYPNELVAIGVHSAKFPGERNTENIRQAILRYEIEHPVINDDEMQVWRLFGVHAWPSLFVIDPVGRIVGYTSGEGVYEPLDNLIQNIIREFDRRGLMNRKRLDLKLERDRVGDTVLSFPGKVLPDGNSKRLFIADSNHNRIVISDFEGDIQEVVGKGDAALRDGSFEEAAFNHPQGMALVGQTLYVADTENHAIRAVDLAERTVTAVAGTGEQARDFNVSGKGIEVALNSPWDLEWEEGWIYIAMAGPHQIWRFNPETCRVEPYAGSGREALIDGPLASAGLAQPSGLTSDGTKIYFADSEISAIRSADLGPKGRVETIVGLDLFEFGDVDGVGSEVRLQHPLGIACKNGILYVADTYNNKIKQVDPVTKKASTFLGTGEEGKADGTRATFDEPGGLSIADGKVYIADTNNHAIRVADLETGEVSTLQLKETMKASH